MKSRRSLRARAFSTWPRRSWSATAGAMARGGGPHPSRQPAPVAAPARPKEEPPLPLEVQVAASELPHLAPETVQLLMSSVAGPSDPPDLFRRATTAAKRGTAALTPAETQELGALRGKAL